MKLLLRLLALLLLLAAPSLPAQMWEKTSVAGRNYVTLASMGRFYGLPEFSMQERSFTLSRGGVRLQGALDAPDLLINGRRFYLSFPITADPKGRPSISQMDVAKLIEPVLRPNRIRGGYTLRTVIIDAGHGGSDLGARSPYGNEKDFTLDTARRTARYLQQMGFQVVMTRSTDIFISLEGRSALANQYAGQAIFLSIHFNDGGSNADANGIESYVMAPQGSPAVGIDRTQGTSSAVAWPGNTNDALNIALGTTAQNSVLRATGAQDRGVKRARFAVIKNTRIPAVLVECGFLTSPSESQRVATVGYRNALARGLARSVQVYQAALLAYQP